MATAGAVTGAITGRLASPAGHLPVDLPGCVIGSRHLEGQVYFPSGPVDGASAKVSVAGEWPRVRMMLG